MTPRQLALHLIKVYVERGDSFESLRSSYLGESCTEYSVAIGGSAWQREKLLYIGKGDEIVVSRVDSKDVCYVFKLRELFNEIKSGQQNLL